jgi:hypothetical protein
MIQDALSEFINMNQATPTVSSARGVDDERAATPTQASHQGVDPNGGKSRISRKKPGDLNISKAIAPEGIRKAPGFPNTGAQELESTLASMEITPNGTKLSSSKPRTSSTLDAPRKSSSTKTRKPGSSSGREKEVLDSGPFGELKNDEFKVVQDLGAGAGGTVDKVIHVPTGTIMAKKVSPPFVPSPLPLAHQDAFPAGSHRRQTRGPKTNPPRTPNHARLLVAVHR